MKARLTEQYDVTVSKREMDELMLALRTFVREFEASEIATEMLAGLEEIYTGPRLGIGITPTEIEEEDDDDEEGGAAVPS